MPALQEPAQGVGMDKLGYPMYPSPVHSHSGPIKGSLYDVLGPIFGKNWKIASGFVKAESKSDPNVTSKNPDGGENRGLFQIDTNTAKAYGLDPNKLFLPGYNARAAWIISKGGKDWHAWATAYANPSDPSTYMSKDAPALKAAETALPNADSAGAFGVIGTGPSDPITPAVTGWADSLSTVLGKLGDGAFWARVGKIVMGAIFLIFGTYLLANKMTSGGAGKVARRAAVL